LNQTLSFSNYDKIIKAQHYFMQKNVQIDDIKILDNVAYTAWKTQYNINPSTNTIPKLIRSLKKKEVKAKEGNQAIQCFRDTSKQALNFFAVTEDQCIFSFKIKNAKFFTYDDAVWLSIHVFPEVILYSPYTHHSFVCNQDGYQFFF
jgi:hypothetical protein